MVGADANTILPVPVAPVVVMPSTTICPLSVGVAIVGEVSTTNLVPVPVCEAIDVALPDEVIGPVRLALVVTVAALPVIEPTMLLVTVRSMNQPLTIRVPVEPIIPLESVASIEAAAPGAEEEVMACVWAVAVELLLATVSVPGVAIVVANDPVPEPVTAPVRVMVWSPVLAPEIELVPVTARVGVELPDMVTLLTVVGVMAPSVRVIAGVVVALATLPETPLAVATETVVTVPDPATDIQLRPPRPSVCKYLPELPVWLGKRLVIFAGATPNGGINGAILRPQESYFITAGSRVCPYQISVAERYTGRLARL